MTFQPVSPLSGIAGWRFLERTQEAQQTAFYQNAQLDRDVEYFKENIFLVQTAEELVNDRRLLTVALGAFGLDEEIDKKFFIQKILAEGTENPGALANRFVDPRYGALAEAFSFGNLAGPQTSASDFGQRITDAYKERAFEIAVGNADGNMRLALGFKREIADYASLANANTAGWFSIMGSTPMRTVFEGAYNLPSEFSGLDVDKQRDILRDRTRELFGSESPAVFLDPDNVNQVIDRFLVRAQINEGPSGNTPGIAALSLLQSSGSFNASAQINLIISNAAF